MTYCLAWKYGASAYLISDTLRTGAVPTSVDRTSLNEIPKQVGREYVDESLLKIREIRDGFAVGISGDTMSAFVAVDFITEHALLFDALPELFDALGKSCGPFDPAHRFGLVIVWADEGNAASIWTWDSQTCLLDEAAESCSLGSLGDNYKTFTAKMLLNLQKMNPSKDALLYNALALVQSYGRHEDLLDQNVGGVICGLRVENGRTIWQEDTITVIYGDDQRINGLLSTHFREGNATVNSTYQGDVGSVFVNCGSDAESVQRVMEWCKRWMPSLREYLTIHFVRCLRWIFINKDRRLATVLHIATKLDDASNLVRVAAQNETLRFDFQPPMLNALWRTVAEPLASCVGLDLLVFEVKGPPAF